jgi:hypothetical protein
MFFMIPLNFNSVTIFQESSSLSLPLKQQRGNLAGRSISKVTDSDESSKISAGLSLIPTVNTLCQRAIANLGNSLTIATVGGNLSCGLVNHFLDVYHFRQIPVNALPRKLERVVERRAHKLYYLTDQQIARKYVKHINYDRTKCREKLENALLPLHCKIEELHENAGFLKNELKDLKSIKNQLDHSLKKAIKLLDQPHISTESIQFLSKKEIEFAIREVNAAETLTKSKIEEATRKKWSFRGEKIKLKQKLDQIQQAIPISINRFNSLTHVEITENLNDLKVYPNLIWKSSNSQFVFSPHQLGLKIIYCSPVKIEFDPGPILDEQTFVRAFLKVADGLFVPNKDLKEWTQEGILKEGWRTFLEKRIIPQCHIDYQSAPLVEKLSQEPNLRIVDVLLGRDIEDSVTLFPYNDPVTLQCGHSFSCESLQRENKCPLCRAEIGNNQKLQNPFLTRLELIFKKKNIVEDLAKQFEHKDSLSEKIAALDCKINTLRNEKANLTKKNKIFQSVRREYQTYYSMTKSKQDSDEPYLEYCRKLQRRIDKIEEEIYLTKTSLHHLQSDLEAMHLIPKAVINSMASALLDSYHKGDLNAIIQMDITRKEYVDRLKQKLESAREDSQP